MFKISTELIPGILALFINKLTSHSCHSPLGFQGSSAQCIFLKFQIPIKSTT